MRHRLPSGLSKSAATDLSMLLADLKPAARLRVSGRVAELRRWARRNGLFASTDRDGYVVLSPSGLAARRTLNLDRRPGRHTAALGLMLGYPACCSRAAARAGDEGIDRLHAKVSAKAFRGLFRLTDPGRYLAGDAHLSHVPCSSSCRASLAIARGHARC